MNKNRIFVIILIIVATASVVLISGYFKKAVYENNPDSETFGIYTATLDGKNMKPLITNSWQQMSHARVSPDGKWVTFSRHTIIGKDGCATGDPNNYERKGEQYLGTEVLIMRIDGTDLRVVVPARKFAVAVNSYWTPDGKGLVYTHGDSRKSRASHLIFDENMEIKSDTVIPTPEYLNPVVDPQWSGDWLVFPAVDHRNNTQGIWRMRLDGSMLEQLTARDPLLYDNDPKISPDGSKVVYSHKINPEGAHYHFMMMDMQTKEEIDLSQGSHQEPRLLWIDVMPEWSSDGKLLVFWHASRDVKNKRAKSVLHTIKPDGTGRKEIPLPEGYDYQMPAFFPGEGSGKDARIIFSTKKITAFAKKYPTPEAAASGSYKKNNITSKASDREVFGIYTATLDGKNMKPLITNSWQQMSHARVSPDKKWVTFTRYTNKGKDGCATENEANYDRKGEQYLGTEVLIMRLDGTDVRTLIPHQKDKVAANSYWTPDGKGLLYVSAPNEKGSSQINHIIFDDDMDIKNISKIPIPENIIPTDPHWVGDWIVFPATEPVSKTRGIWRIKYNGEGLQQLTWPKIKVPMSWGDNDPKLSPDGSKVAFIRRVKEGPFFHVVVVDVNTKEERDFSAGYLPQEARAAADLPPEWSSDGKLLIFPHILVDGKKALSQMHTIKPDGTGRKRVPLPRNYVYFHTSFFPGEGSGKDARIIFSTRKISNLGKGQPVPKAVTSGSYEKINIIGEASHEEIFGIYTANLDGSDMKLLISDSYRQMTHARVSPDKKWVSFTRFNKIGKDGCATEAEDNYDKPGEQYEETEILLMRLDGSDLRVLIPPQKGKAAANGYWTPDGKGLIYIYGDGRKSRASHLIFDEDMEIKSNTEIPTPNYLAVVDPQWGKDSSGNDRIVFPARNLQTGRKGLWWVKPDGSSLEQLTWPELQDNDPKFSPDGTKIAFMRRVKEGLHWHSMILDLKTRKEKDLSAGYFPEDILVGADAMPEWSSDGRLLVLWHVFPDLKNKRVKSVLHTISPDGTRRKEIPLPEGYNYQMPVFFPGEGSGKDARIIFSTRKISNLGRRPLDSEAAVSNGYEKINIIGEVNTSGIYDPSVEYNEDGSVGWMTYSSIDAPKYIRTNLAKTLDHGKTWTFVKTINSSVDGKVRLGNKVIDGSWWNEVSTLVHDPYDPGKEWKLFWHKYFAKHDPGAGAGNRVLQYGWIAYKYSNNPAGKWSEEIPLFGAGPFPLKPHKTRINLSRLHPDLKGLFAYTEPGSIYKNGVLYLSLQGHKFVNKQNIAKIILIASYDHGKTWRYIGTLLENKDAQKFGAKIFTGSSLVGENGRLFLFATPEDPGRDMAEASNKGVVIFEFEDITNGKLKRDEKGEPIARKYLKPPLGMGGQSDYDEQNTYGGIIMPQMNLTAYPEAFQIFNTKEKIIP